MLSGIDELFDAVSDPPRSGHDAFPRHQIHWTFGNADEVDDDVPIGSSSRSLNVLPSSSTPSRQRQPSFRRPTLPSCAGKKSPARIINSPNQRDRNPLDLSFGASPSKAEIEQRSGVIPARPKRASKSAEQTLSKCELAVLALCQAKEIQMFTMNGGFSVFGQRKDGFASQ
ncbi:hypothetical protein BD324DRAFT_619202 [Kockovaella imperatae]|uniref:Uncharacterized protein n=1 Tax=Kockovaella imperatae TaxID=4999 RepID=A0A1Y1UML7_9TREE|nr:hypothetical protein BD324DRAFT_619202 [Kockovaella imperatae]ORX39301.1 hypothetical protein BD324DRAFT_619202 [Kockovaella imperatae]